MAPETLRKWRERGKTSKGEKPPKCFKRGTQYYYSIAELDHWIEQGTVYGGEKIMRLYDYDDDFEFEEDLEEETIEDVIDNYDLKSS